MRVTEFLGRYLRDNHPDGYCAGLGVELGGRPDCVPLENGARADNVFRATEFLRKVEARTTAAIAAGESLIIRFGQGQFDSGRDQLFIKCEGTFADRLIIRTGNIVGQIQGLHDGYRLSVVVSSRFGDLFLHRMIALSEGFIELEDVGGTPYGGMSEWLLVYLWKVRLRQAFVAGIPKEYVSRQGRLTTVRGNLDINSLLRLPADIGQYPCHWREHSFDNPVTRLIYTTFKTLSRRDEVAALVSDAHREKNAFGEACGGCIVRPPFTQQRRKQTPYFAAYDEVADLSRKILANETADLSLNEDEFSGFLFDVSLLFENYIRRLFVDGRLRVEPKEKDVVAYPTGGTRQRRLLPDITLHGLRSSLILDTKYKWWNERDGASREDAFQVITYASAYRRQYPNHPVRGYGLIFPRPASMQHGAASIEQMFVELGMRFYVFFLDIPGDGMFESAEASLVGQVTSALHVLDQTEMTRPNEADGIRLRREATGQPTR